MTLATIENSKVFFTGLSYNPASAECVPLIKDGGRRTTTHHSPEELRELLLAPGLALTPDGLHHYFLALLLQ